MGESLGEDDGNTVGESLGEDVGNLVGETLGEDDGFSITLNSKDVIF